MPYDGASYAEVLRWLENTEIQYVPNGKRAGTKSFDRYEKYSQAKTVADALELGSLPLDLVHDFEKKLLKRVGGPVRDKPLNLAEVADTSVLSKTDMIIGRWGYKFSQGDGEGTGAGTISGDELKRRRLEQKEAVRQNRLALKPRGEVETMGQSSCVESPDMAQQRAHANEEAAAVLRAAADEARDVSDDDVLRVLRLWAIQKNGDRKGVMPDGAAWVHSETVGLLQCSGSRLEATLHTRRYPKVLELFARWMKDHRPEGHTRDFPFTSIIVNSSFAAKRHRDLKNLGPVVVKAFGEFQGGALRYWAEDDRRSSVEALLEHDGTQVDVHSKPSVIDGNRAHQVEAYTGKERFSLVFFTAQSCDKVTDDVREQLVQLGFPVPDEECLSYLKGLLPTPQGYAAYAEEPKIDLRSQQSKALSVLKGLQKPKKEGLTQVASRGLLARVLAKRTQGNMSSPQAEATTQKPATASNVNKPATFGGLLARVQKQNVIPSANSNADVAGSPSPPPAQGGKRKIKPLSFGGLLARVQQRALPGSPLATPSTTAEADSSRGEAPPGERTPARKRPLAEMLNGSHKNQMAFSGKKLDRPPKSLKMEKEVKHSAATVAESTFLSLAKACYADEEDVANTLADCLRGIAGRADNRQDALTAAMALLAPSKVIAGKILATALSEAFGSPVPNMRAEGLAAMAVDGRHRHTRAQLSPPLTIQDVSDALTLAGDTPDDLALAVKSLTRLFLRTQTGVEPFFLVRALQGQLTSNADVVHSAVAKAMTPVTVQ